MKIRQSLNTAIATVESKKIETDNLCIILASHIQDYPPYCHNTYDDEIGWNEGVTDAVNEMIDEAASNVLDELEVSDLAQLAARYGYELREKLENCTPIDDLIAEQEKDPEIKKALDKARLELWAEKIRKLGYAVVPLEPTMNENTKVSLNKVEFIELCDKLLDTDYLEEILPNKDGWHFGRCEMKLIADILYSGTDIPKL